MSDIIQLLPDYVANQIAAGEVIQRPASAVKELLENAIDAKATEIKLIIKDAGRTLIQVIDNGIGMSPTDARLAFERHATSKIRVADDLFHLHTKGFRGEALASIAAVAQVELTTAQEGEEIGTELVIEGNKIISQQPSVVNKGTSIAMKNLFFNVPARRKFLKADSVEFRHILDEFHRVVLAHPDIHFYLYNNATELYNLPAASLRKRIVQVFGSKLDERLVPVEEKTDILNIYGFICKSSFKKNKSLQYLIVNQRFIKSPYLHNAIKNAYEGLLKENEQPEYFLYLELSPELIDINIHPTKTEIKFENDHIIYALVRSAVKHSLGQFQVFPSIDFELSQENEVPYSYKDKEAKLPTYQVDSNFNPFQMDFDSQAPKQEKYTSSKSFDYKKHSPSWENLYTGIPSKVNEFQQIKEEPSMPNLLDSLSVEASKQTILYFQKKYLITYLKEKVLIINATRAHQRILYERFTKNIRTGINISEQLLFPLEFEFSPTEVLSIISLSSVLETAGFLFETEGNKVRVLGLPTLVKESQALEILKDLIADNMEDIPQENFSQEDILAKNLAKTLSIRSGQSLSSEEQEQLIADLFSCKECNVSPFGKKIFTELSINEIDSKF
jgi:DNA mismatch repair protein mutL